MLEEKMKETKSYTKENIEENNKKINLTLIKKETPIKIDKRNLDNTKENIENKTEIKEIKENDNINNTKTKIQIYKKNKGKGKSCLMGNNTNNFF